MRAAVVVSSLNILGGSEKVSLEIIMLLKDLGYRVDVVTMEKLNRKSIMKLRNIDIDTYVDNEIVILPHIRLVTIYSTYLAWLFRDVIAVPFLRRRYDLTITTCELLAWVFTDMLYLHTIDLSVLHEYNILYQKYRRSAFLTAYSRPYWRFARCVARLSSWVSSRPVIITNSTYNKRIMKVLLGLDTIVVYPPVDVEQYFELSKRPNRKDLVLTICRFDEAKNLETIVDVAVQVKSRAQFVVIGSTHSEREEKYADTLVEKIRQEGLDEKVTLVMNASNTEKMRWLSESKILLHPTKGEHFGIAIVEGMAAGLVPVVHASGGAWEDIVKYGTYGFGFRDSRESASIIDNLLINSDLYNEMKALAVSRAESFSTKRFRDQFKLLIDYFQSARARAQQEKKT